MDWLDEKWPEDTQGYFDVVETATPLLTTAFTRVVPANPQRVAIIFGLANATSGAFLSTKSTGTTNQGINFPTASFSTLSLNREDHGALVAIAWFALSIAAGGQMTTFEVILNRPQPRPYAHDPNQSIIDALAKNGMAGKLAKMLRKQSKWREKIYNELRAKYGSATNTNGAGAGMATAVADGLRHLDASLSGMRPASSILAGR